MRTVDIHGSSFFGGTSITTRNIAVVFNHRWTFRFDNNDGQARQATVAVLAMFGQPLFALAVGLSVVGGGAVSALAAFLLQRAFLHLGFDPVLGSWPICTIRVTVS